MFGKEKCQQGTFKILSVKQYHTKKLQNLNIKISVDDCTLEAYINLFTDVTTINSIKKILK